MAEVKAITSIKHGIENKVKYFDVGDTLTTADFTDEQLSELVTTGAAVELGKNRKYSAEPSYHMVDGAVDNEATKLRDQLIAQSQEAETEKPKAITIDPDAQGTNKNPPPAPVK